MDKFPRITIDPGMMTGLPCVRGMRMPVASVLRPMADGWSRDQILRDWPELQSEDIDECLRFGSELASFRDVAA